VELNVGVIPAAGKGVRAYPTSTYISKVMLEIAGKPLVLRNLEIMRDQLGIKTIYIIIGHLGHQISFFLGDGSKYGVNIKYVFCNNPDIGLARGLLLVKEYIQDKFVTILGDELYVQSNHKDLMGLEIGDFSAICGVNKTKNPLQIQKNYSVELEDRRITKLIEKPQEIKNDLLGCGTYIFTPVIFEEIERSAPSLRSGRVELTDVINTMAETRKNVYAFDLTGEYHNINSIEEYNAANYAIRSYNFSQYKVSVIIPTYNEETSIGYVVSDFIEQVDEVFVVDNSSSDKTAEIARNLGARVEVVKLKGYGDTIKYGLDNAIGDILIVVEADYSFRSKDLLKILTYLRDADMVMGTRTTREMIEQGANMPELVRWGNVIVAKLVELFWWKQEPRFTDVGCTYRGIWKDCYLKFRDRLRGTGPEFAPEMMVEALRARRRVIEIPVSYYPRVGGKSKHSQSYFKIARTALRMVTMIISSRFNLGRKAVV
jgi:dTDP-glucose pyrophosphorylase